MSGVACRARREQEETMLTKYEEECLNELRFEYGYNCLTPEQIEAMHELEAKRDETDGKRNG